VGLPIVFVQATGPSAVLDPRGHIVAATKHGVVDVLDADVRLERAATVTPSVSSLIGPLALLISLVMRIPFQRRWLTRREVSPMS